MAMGLSSSGNRRGRGGSRRTPMAEINVTPFVDVMLVLLIIFMVTAPLLASGVPVELPESRANPLDQDPEQVTIAIDNAGFIYIDDAQVDRGGFPDAIAQVAQGGCPLITLRADTSLDYGRVMAVMGELNRAGCSSISLVTTGSSQAP